jgi:hypothetical protein
MLHAVKPVIAISATRTMTTWRLMMRLSDAGHFQRRTKTLCLNDRLPPSLTDAITLDPYCRQWFHGCVLIILIVSRHARD